jgi:hypothetical protein
MPARANIVVNDAASPSPVAHTFNPSEDGEVDLFEDKSGGIAIGFPLISVRFRRPGPPTSGAQSSANGRVYRVHVNFTWPVLEVTSPSTGTGIQPAPTVAYVLRCNQEWLLPERSTLQDRKDLRAIVYNSLNNSDIKKVVEELEAFW